VSCYINYNYATIAHLQNDYFKKLNFSFEYLTFSESVPVAKMLLYTRVTLRLGTRPPGVHFISHKKLSWLLDVFVYGLIEF